MSQAPQPPPTGPPSGEPPAGQPPSGSPGGGGSRSVWTTVAVVGGVIALAVVLFLVLRPDDDSENAASTAPTAETTTTVETTTESTTEVTTTSETTTETAPTTTTPPEDRPQRVIVRFMNGEVVGGVVQAEIEQGKQVVVVVRADVEDEAHLHGYNLFTNVAPGQPGRITFRADKAGEFELELEDRGIPIAELIVSP